MQQVLRHRLTQAQIQFRVVPGQIPDDRRQQIGGDGRDHAHAQAAHQPVLRGARQIRQLVHAAQNVAGAQGKLLAKGGQTHGARAPFKQVDAQRLFQILDLHGQRRLRDGAKIGGAAKMTLGGQSLKIAHLFEGDVVHQNNLSS